MVNFPEPEKKRANFMSNKKIEYYVHITHYFYSKWVNFKSTIVLEHVRIKTFILYKNRLRKKYFVYLLKKYEKLVNLRVKIPT